MRRRRAISKADPARELCGSALSSEESFSSAYLDALIKNSPVAIIVLDSKHRFQMCNEAFERLFQYSQAELRRSEVDALIASSEARKEAADITRRVLSGENVHTLATRCRKDGSLVDVEIYGVPLIVRGRLRGVYGMYQDVTERNRAERTVRELSTRLLHLQEQERRRIARDLHDNTAQQLAAINLNLRRLQRSLSAEQQYTSQLIEDTVGLVNECSREVRSLSYLLHPPLLSEAGLRPALSWLAEGFERRSGIKVHLEVAAEVDRLAADSEAALFRVAQEGLSNALRHSGTPEVSLQLRREPQEVVLRISDKGRGITGEASQKQLGVGITGMKERLAQLGGRLDIASTKHGTIVTAVIPTELGTHVKSAHSGN